MSDLVGTDCTVYNGLGSIYGWTTGQLVKDGAYYCIENEDSTVGFLIENVAKISKNHIWLK